MLRIGFFISFKYLFITPLHVLYRLTFSLFSTNIIGWRVLVLIILMKMQQEVYFHVYNFINIFIRLKMIIFCAIEYLNLFGLIVYLSIENLFHRKEESMPKKYFTIKQKQEKKYSTIEQKLQEKYSTIEQKLQEKYSTIEQKLQKNLS